jgi:hypothetical protein
MFVQRTPFGFYWAQIDRPGFRWHYAFSEDQPTVTFEENITEFEYDDYRAEYVSYDVDEAGFLAYFAAKTGSLPKPPLSDQLYPRKSLLLLISGNGLRYLLPIDSNQPLVVSDSELSAVLLSFPCEPRQWKVSLGCDTAFDSARLVPLDDFTGVRRYIDGDPERFVNNYGLPVAPGDTASFANTGELAVWGNGHLTVYDAYAGQQGMARRLIEHSVSTPINGNIRQTAWSADGQQFAFSDSDGVWILSLADPIRLNRPVLLAPSGDPLHFSPDGKYLAISDQDSRYTIALETAERLPYRIYAPDMNHFVEIQDAVLLDSTIEIAKRADHIAWKDSSTIMLRTGSEIGWFDLDGKKLFAESGSDFEIARSGEVIVLVDSNTLSIDQHAYSVELEGGIAEIRWMPPSWEYRWFCEFLC